MIQNEDRLLEIIYSKKKVYIYGAGEVGQLLLKRIKKQGGEVLGFCVSDLSYRKKDEIILDDLPKQSFVIVAVDDKLREQFVYNLQQKGDVEYAVLSEKLIHVMRWFENCIINFQTHLVEHCNLNCRGCYHFSPLAKPRIVDVFLFRRDFERLSFLLKGHAGEIMLLGGEPLLHPQINELIRIARNSFTSAQIKVLTNGILISKMDDSFFKTLSDTNIELWVTKYPINCDYDRAESRANEFGIKLKYFNTEPVRTLGHQPLDIKGSKDYKENFYNCYRSNVCMDLKDGKLFSCIIPAEIKTFNDFFGMNIPVTEEDYVDIYSVNSAEELISLLRRPMPFCRFCDRENIVEFGDKPWQLSKRTIEEWTV